MNYNRTVESVAKVRRIKKLKAMLQVAAKVAVDDDPEVKRLRVEINKTSEALGKLHAKLRDAQLEAEDRNVANVRHVREEIEELTRASTESKSKVSDRIKHFICAICHGVDYGAAHQVLWHNERFVVLKLPPRSCFSGQGRPARYVKVRYALYDLDKFPENYRGRPGWEGFELEASCRVHRVEGRLGKIMFEAWKEQAAFVKA